MSEQWTDEQIEEFREDLAFIYEGEYDPQPRREAFAAWLAAVIAKARREERELAAADALDSMIDDFFKGDANCWSLPTSVIAWIRARPEYIVRYGNQEAGVTDD